MGADPPSYDHVFCTVQSFGSRDLAARFGDDYWHTVIIDECHHMTAASYRVLAGLRPRILLGLTATPERADGVQLDAMFDMRLDGAPAAELRLWEALDQQLLAPFEYYGVDDQATDLSDVRWERRGQEVADLDRILSGNHRRAGLVMSALEKYVGEPRRMRALAFCVSVEHARFMAGEFARHGLAAEVVVGDTDPVVRRSAPGRLVTGELQVLCTCDLYNEGVDIPEIDTLLILRPSQSPVLIQQQLGRGLRLAPGKESCLVIDLVGRHGVEFRFDRMLGLLSGLPRGNLAAAIDNGFANLPPGCHIHLDHLTREQALRNLRQLSIRSWRHVQVEAAAWLHQAPARRQADLATFLRDTGIELTELYRGGNATQARGWAALRRACGIEARPAGADEARVSHRIPNLLVQDDPALLRAVERVAENGDAYAAGSVAERKRIDAVSAELFPARTDAVPGRALSGRLADTPALREELAQIARIVDDADDRRECPVPDMPADWPFNLHCAYSLRTLMLLTGRMLPDRRALPQAGVIPFHQRKIEVLLVTLDKSTGFSASTSYHDYAISPERFHWQTQNKDGPATTAGRRYSHGATDGWVFQLFVRENKGDLYRALGPVRYEDHVGEKPMSITWQMVIPIPLGLFGRYSVLRQG